MVKFSTDKHAQPNFVRDSCVYTNFGQCDWALNQSTKYKSDVECRFVSRNGQMTLKVKGKVNASHFLYQLRES